MIPDQLRKPPPVDEDKRRPVTPENDLSTHPEGYVLVMPTLRGWTHAATYGQEVKASGQAN